MKIYRASNELIDILIKNGFKEVTEKYHPEHLAYMAKVGYYNPDTVKRWFQKGRIKFWFDYINLHISYNSAYSFTTSITENQLKSIIFFSNIKSSDKQFFTIRNIKPFEIHEYISKESSILRNKKQLVNDFHNLTI